MVDLHNLTNYLVNSKKNEEFLSFEQIETILGFKLPDEALKNNWWKNKTKSKRAQAWLKAGFKVVEINHIEIRRAIVFRKTDKNINEQNNAQTSFFKRTWLIITDSDADYYKRIMAFINLIILPSIAVFGLVISIVSVDRWFDKTSIEHDSSIQIVDILNMKDYITLVTGEDEEDSYECEIGTFIDIKLRNTGEQAGFIKKVIFHIDEIVPLKNPYNEHYQTVPVSETYDLVLNDDKEQSINISQVVPPTGVDRFRFKVLSSCNEERMDVIYLMSLSFIYDEDDKEIFSQKYLFVLPPKFNYVGSYSTSLNYDNWKNNYSEIMRLNKLASRDSTINTTPYFDYFVKKYEEENALSKKELYDKYSNIIVNFLDFYALKTLFC